MMNGNTLLVSRDVNWHEHHKKFLKSLGFRDVTATAAEKDGLNMVISDLKPRLMIIRANFYLCATPLMMWHLLQRFPALNIAVVNMADYPPDHLMGFIRNGVRSCIDYQDGVEQFYKGLEYIRDGKKFISESITERIELRDEMPGPVKILSPQQEAIAKLMRNGLTTVEIGEVLHISERTIYNQKNRIYESLHVRNDMELMRLGSHMGIVNDDDLNFFPKDYSVKPLPDKAAEKHDGHLRRNIFLVKSADGPKRQKQTG
jgi:DNA-binding NarL/FixJ family response regulator